MPPEREMRGGERGNQKSRVFARLQSSELHVINPLNLFNIVFQKFTHTLTHRSEQGEDYRGDGEGPAPSGHWKVCTLGSLLPDRPGVGIGGSIYRERGRNLHPRVKVLKPVTSQISFQKDQK